MNKPKIIIFEGLDKTGKSTILQNFAKQTNFKYWGLDRGVLSCIVYDELFDRGFNKEFDKLLKYLNKHFDLRIIYCIADYQLIKKRLKQNEEILPQNLQDLQKVDFTFRKYIKQYHLKYLEVNTTYHNVDECTNYIIEKLERNEKEWKHQ